eukprot:286160_1
MTSTRAQTELALELSKPTTFVSAQVEQEPLEIIDNDKRKCCFNKKQRKRWKKFTVQCFTIITRAASLIDLITDGLLLYKSSINQVMKFTIILSLSMISPYVLSYSSGIKLFIYRKTFDSLQGFKKIALAFYLLPFGFFYFIFLDLLDIVLSIWLWLLFNICQKSEQFLKESQQVICEQLGMDRMNFEGLKRQKAISQILFETIPQVTLQILLVYKFIPGQELAGISNQDIYLSITAACINVVVQMCRLYFESVAVSETFVEYCLNAMMGRIGWVPYRVKYIKLSRNLQYRYYNKNTKNPKLVSRAATIYGLPLSKNDYVIDYRIKYRIPIISLFFNIDVDVDYDFSPVTISHLIATINQSQALLETEHSDDTENQDEKQQISILFHNSLKLLGVAEIVQVMEACKRKNILLPDVCSQCIDWNSAFNISATRKQTDPRLLTNCKDYNGRPLLTAMYLTEYDDFDRNYPILRAFLNNDVTVDLKDSLDQTIVYYMIEKDDYKALKILFQKQNA